MRKKFVTFLIIGVALSFSGCSVWEDFTTYFNLYYNTTDLFNQAETAIKDSQKDPFSLVEVPIPANAQTLLSKVIEKCSNILQFRSKSSFVDNALLMIGKSFYYQKNYIKALRKFQELQSSYPASKLILDSRLWLAKTDLQMKNSEKGLKNLLEMRQDAINKKEFGMVSDSYIEEIRYYLALEDYEKVQSLCSLLLNSSNDDKLKAKTAFALGNINEKQNKIKEAAEAYASVKEFTSSYELLFSSAIQYAKMLIRQDKAEDALKLLYSLKKEAKYKEFYDQIDFQIAIAYRQLGEINPAMQILLQFDSLYSASAHIGNARFEKAGIYEKNYKNYDSAIVYYQKALSSTATADYLPKIRDRSTVFNKYTSLNASFIENIKQYFYAVYPSEYSKDSAKFAQAAEKTKPVEKKDTVKADAPMLERERKFEEIEGTESEDQVNLFAKDTATKVNKTAPRKPLISKDSIIVLLAKESIDIGNLFLTDLNLPDSAKYYYNLAITNYECPQYMPRALFSLGSYYLTKNDSSSADSVFNFIYDNYKSDKIVNEAALKLNKPTIDFDFDPAKDVFLSAEVLYKNKEYISAAQKYYEVSSAYPQSRFAPKALMAIGKILEDKIKLSDSAAVIYDTLITKYPNSRQAVAMYPRLNVYKEEKIRLKKVISDSLKVIADSLKLIENLKLAAMRNDSLNAIKKDSIAAKKIIDSTASENHADSLAKPIDTKLLNTADSAKKTIPLDNRVDSLAKPIDTKLFNSSDTTKNADSPLPEKSNAPVDTLKQNSPDVKERIPKPEEKIKEENTGDKNPEKLSLLFWETAMYKRYLC